VSRAGTDTERLRVRGGETGSRGAPPRGQTGENSGVVEPPPPAPDFAPPTLESVVAPADRADGQRLRVALAQLAEQDPLINVRQDDTRGEMSVSLYGEVQREVIEATLAAEYGLEVEFRGTTPICIERPTAAGEAVEMLNTATNPFHADLGLRVAPAAPDSGVELRVHVDPRDAPLYIFKTFQSFVAHMNEYVRLALEEGLFGWQ